MSRRPIPVDPARLEELARTQPTQLAVAAALGMAQNTLIRKLFNEPELRRAYERGRLDRAAAEGNTRRPFCRTTPGAGTFSIPEPPAPAPPPAPTPQRPTGTPSEIVVKALSSGGLTFGGLMHATGLDWHKVVAEVQRLKTSGRVRSAEVGGQMRHFLVVRRCGCGAELTPEDVARKARDYNGGLACYDCYSRLCEDAAAERDRRLGLDEDRDGADLQEASW